MVNSMPVVISHVDIYQYPPINEITIYNENSTVTEGDLHGNAAKFLHVLVRQNLVTISKETYAKLIDIYINKSDDSTSFYDLLSEAKASDFSPGLLRLLGDDFADRGKNDLFIEKIYRLLNDLGINFEVIMSNHTKQFLKQFGNGLTAKESELKMFFKGEYKAFARSFYGMREEIENKERNINLEDIENSIVTNYLPKLKMLSYEIVNENKIKIFSHAPINSEKIEALAGLFQVKVFNLNTTHGLKKAIDAINDEFSEIFSSKDMVKEFFHFLDNNRELSDVFESFIDNRYIPAKPANSKKATVHDEFDSIVDIRLEELPDSSEQHCEVINIHGHTGEGQFQDNSAPGWSYINTDTNLAKDDHTHKHTYATYVTMDENDLVLDHTKSDTENIIPIQEITNNLNKKILEIIISNVLNIVQDPNTQIGKTLKNMIVNLCNQNLVTVSSDSYETTDEELQEVLKNIEKVRKTITNLDPKPGLFKQTSGDFNYINQELEKFQTILTQIENSQLKPRKLSE